MGVQGLTTYVEGNRHFLQDVKFRDSRLLIDGCSLYFRLYFNHGLDQQHGGDYDAFVRLLTQFLSTLAACNIQPYVVLDGGIDPSGKKFNTLRQRLQSKIKEADNIAHGRHGSVLPILTRDVFIQVLIQSGVPLVQCASEADWEIACLARQWNCPLLSNDSDFFIFDLPGGYFPFSSFHWTNPNGKANQRYISARWYTTSVFCRSFGGMNKELLPLCAVLCGNDYDTPKEAEDLVSLIVNVSVIGGGRGQRRPASRIEGLLGWLSSFSGPAEALAEMSRLIEEDGISGQDKVKKKRVVSSHLRAGMQEYNIACQSSLAQWFSGRKEPPGAWTSLKLTGCLVDTAAQGLLAPLAVDALVMQRVLLMPQVENGKLASSHCSAKSIRQAMYGILLQQGQCSLTQGKGGVGQVTKDMRVGSKRGRGAQGRGRGRDQMLPMPQCESMGISHQKESTVQGQRSCPTVYVEEYDRTDQNLKKNQVEANQLKKPLSLDEIDQASPAARLAVLLEVLGVTEHALSSVPVHLRLAVAVSGFWLREAKPTPTQPQLQALLLGFVYGQLNHQQHTERNLSAAMDRQRIRPGERRGLDLKDAHCYSQWQACLWAALCLNHLMLQPLPDPYLPWLFSGTLVHGLVKSLKEGRAPECLLQKGSLSDQLYVSLLDAVNRCVYKGRSASSASGRGRRGGRGKKRGSAGGGGAGRGTRATQEINNRFALLMSEEEYYDE